MLVRTQFCPFIKQLLYVTSKYLFRKFRFVRIRGTDVKTLEDNLSVTLSYVFSHNSEYMLM